MLCAEATINDCYTKAEYAASTTKIYVVDSASADARIDLDAEWKVGYYVRIDNAASLASEEFAIATVGNDGGGSFFTVAGGLAATKVIGSRVILVSRNIMLTGVTDTGTYGLSAVRNSSLSLGIRNCNRGLNSCYFNTITTCSPSGCTYGLNSCRTSTITTCSPSGCTNGLNTCYAITIGDGAFGSNTAHFRRCYDIFATGLTFGTGTKWLDCNSTYTGPRYNEVQNDGGVAGALSARTAGGETTHTTGSGNFTHTCEDAEWPAYRQITYHVPPGATIIAQLVGTMSTASMTAGIQLLKAYGEEVLDSDDFAANTSEQTLNVTWTNGTVLTGLPNVYVTMRVNAMYSSGTLVEVTESGVSIGLEVGEVENGVTWIDYDGEQTGTLSGGGGVIPLVGGRGMVG